MQNTPVRFVELIPPAVQTALAGPSNALGAPLEAFCDAVFALLQSVDIQLGSGDVIGFGPTDSPEFKRMLGEAEPLFRASSARFPVQTYSY